MPTVWKDILYPGRWHLRDGRTFECSQSDLSHYTRRMKDMIAAGLPIPLSWEHQASVKPGNPDEARAERTKLTLGHTSAVRDSAGILETRLEVPDAADAKKLPAVRFVSPFIEWDFVDGSGKKWDGPSITHIAVTPRPIQHTQRAFGEPAALSLTPGAKAAQTCNRATRNAKPVALSLSDYEGPMDDDEKKKPKDGDGDGIVNEDTPDEAPADDAGGLNGPEDKSAEIAEVVQLLAPHKIVLGEGISSIDDFFQRLKAALHTKGAHDGTGVEGDPNNPQTQAMATEVSMSLEKNWQTRAERAESKLIDLEHASLLRRIKSLRESGKIAKPLADKLENQAKSVSLSLDPSTGAVNVLPLLSKVEAYEELPKNAAFPLSRGDPTEQQPPERLLKDNRKAQEDAGDELARMAGASEPQKAAA